MIRSPSMAAAPTLERHRPKHPAQYTPAILEALDETLVALPPGSRILDPFGGRGDRLAELADRRGWHLACLEIEYPWASFICGDATNMPFADETIDAVATSVTYANGLADAGLNWKSHKGRRTYDIFLGQSLRSTNTGRYGIRQGRRAFEQYLELHRAAFAEVRRVLRPGGVFALNCSDVIAAGDTIPVTAENERIALEAGLELVARRQISTPRYRNGANADARADAEDLVILRRPAR